MLMIKVRSNSLIEIISINILIKNIQKFINIYSVFLLLKKY